jgi:DeoR/GlpR family transcriptional regulator of sugar metabolism
MLKSERQAFILHNINLHNRILSSDLSETIQVSEDTVRRDLQELADCGKIIKVHGGALSKSFHSSFNTSSVYGIQEKRIIAHKAAALIKDGMFVFTTGGTTIMELAKCLPANLKATFITGSLSVALDYIQNENIEVIIIGDKLSKSSKITVGGKAIQSIKEIKADLCFLGVNGLDADTGLTDNDWEVVQIKKAMIESSTKVVALTIAEKIGTTQPIKVCDIGGIDVLITELDKDAERLQVFKQHGIEIL